MIRMAVPEDAAGCLSIYNWYIENSDATFETELLSEEEFRARIMNITESYPWIVYEEDGVIRGYAYLSAFNPRQAYRWTCDLAVYTDRKMRGRGIGSLLISAMIRLAYQDGYYRMVSLITRGNTASERIHEKFGFQKCGVLEKTGYKSGKWLDVSFYMLKLREGTPGTITNEEIRQV